MINIKRTNYSVILSHDGNKNTVTEDNDLFFDSTSLYVYLNNLRCDAINESDKPYKYCMGIIYNVFKDVYCVYNENKEEWLLSDATWTKDRYEKNMAFFKEPVKNLPSGYFNQIRKVPLSKEHFIK